MKNKVVGVTKDGVKILSPKVKPTNFTVEQIREAVRKVLNKPKVSDKTHDEAPADTHDQPNGQSS